MKQLRNQKTGTIVVEKLSVADSFVSRFFGLMGRKELPETDGLLITKCNSIHMFFMKFAIDAVYLDKELRVVDIAADLQPGKLSSCKKAKHTLEIPAGRAERIGIEPGDTLEIIDNHEG